MGYMIVDHRGGGGKLEECDTVACQHCRRAMRTKRRLSIPGSMGEVETGLYCMRCAGPVCEPCGATGVCTPFLAKIEEGLRRQALSSALGLQGG
jgi:hypothetical protein